MGDVILWRQTWMEVVLGLCTDGIQAFPKVPPFTGVIPLPIMGHGTRTAIHVILVWLDTDYMVELTDEEVKEIK